MKKAFLIAPLLAALLFTIPKSWELMRAPDASYIPVVFELLLLALGYAAAAVLNALVIVPLCLLVRLRTTHLAAGFGLAVFVSLCGTTVAYAYEIFGYRPSILEPAYFYPLLIPQFVMTLASFHFLRAAAAARGERDADGPAEAGEDAVDIPEVE